MTSRALLYPLKFRPRLVEKMWGGRKLQTVLGKPLPHDKPIGESWELYDFPPAVVEPTSEWVSSVIDNGSLAGRSLHWAMGEFGPDLHGGAVVRGAHGPQFPILIKFLDAREDLSVQVHPDAEYAAAHPESHLKSEAWYVLQSDPGARLLKGMRSGAGRHELEAAIARGDVDQVIESIPTREGECYYLPSGTIHALGAGLLVAEVQTPSDTTFRVFDFNRVDPSTGKQRQLHVKQALECIDFSASPSEPSPPASTEGTLVNSPYFQLRRFHLHPGATRQVSVDGAAGLILLNGTIDLQPRRATATERAHRGEVILLPPALQEVSLTTTTGCGWLEVTFRQQHSLG